jgi:hypothetical protein
LGFKLFPSCWIDVNLRGDVRYCGDHFLSGDVAKTACHGGIYAQEFAVLSGLTNTNNRFFKHAAVVLFQDFFGFLQSLPRRVLFDFRTIQTSSQGPDQSHKQDDLAHHQASDGKTHIPE